MSSLYRACLFAERALLPEGWRADVRIAVGPDGRIEAVADGSDAAGAVVTAGPLVPAMPNLHSHAFQRAMAGLAEVAGEGGDSFWTWRDTMYRIARTLTPEDVGAIAVKLYVEMLKGGYGSVAEFHYLHHAPGGEPHADPAEMSRRILDAAAQAGIGLTLLPVFYAHADFGGVPPHAGQARFVHDEQGFLRLLEGLAEPVRSAGASLGIAFHSLRAATPDEMRAILAAAPASAAGPIHIHAAEQTAEVEACLAWSGRRPVRWLLDEMGADRRWCLIHATHMEPGEVGDLARSGAVAGLCPTTEANLGDGLFEATGYLGQGGAIGIGSDSHVATSVAEELRLLEYGQRLRDRRRNVLSGGAARSVGRRLFDAALAGGAQALGQGEGRIAPGAFASFAVLDGDEPFIAASDGDAILDRWIFALGARTVRDVIVRGRWVIRDRRHDNDETIDAAFRRTLGRLAAVA